MKTMSDDKKVIVDFLGNLVNYEFGKNDKKFFEPHIRNFRSNLLLLQSFKIIPPLTFLAHNKNWYRLYWESVLCFLFGFSNSSITNIVRVLEQALIEKYEEIEKKPSNLKLESLINWSQEYLKEDSNIAHYFRKLRNYVHTDKLVKPQDCLEGIRHMSIIITKLYPNVGVVYHEDCDCGHEITYQLILPDGILSDIAIYHCNECGRKYKRQIPLFVTKSKMKNVNDN